METILKGFSNRELALLIWITGFFIWFLFKGGGPAVWNVIKASTAKKLLATDFVVITYVIGLISLLKRLDLWNMEMMKDTVYWFFGTAFVLIMNSGKINQVQYFKGVIKSSIKVGIIVELLLHLYTFSFPVELLFTPFLLLLVSLQAFIEVKKDKEMDKAAWLIKGILRLTGSILFLVIVKRIADNFGTLWNIENLKSLVLAPLLTILYLPVVFLIALYTHYETLFMEVDWLKKNPQERRKIKMTLLKTAKLNLNRISYLDKNIYRLYEYDTDTIENLLKRLFKNNSSKRRVSNFNNSPMPIQQGV